MSNQFQYMNLSTDSFNVWNVRYFFLFKNFYCHFLLSVLMNCQFYFTKCALSERFFWTLLHFYKWCRYRSSFSAIIFVSTLFSFLASLGSFTMYFAKYFNVSIKASFTFTSYFIKYYSLNLKIIFIKLKQFNYLAIYNIFHY